MQAAVAPITSHWLSPRQQQLLLASSCRPASCLPPTRSVVDTHHQTARHVPGLRGPLLGLPRHGIVVQAGPEPLQQLEVAVPRDQRPSNELQQLKSGQLYSWGTLPLGSYIQRLALVFAFFFALVGGPISYQTFDPFDQPLEWALSASVGSLVVVAIVVVRVYLGWAYVGDRLMSASVEYEETGWYDGEVFVKPPEVLTRDRLLGMYEVQPVMAKLRTTLIGSGVLLLTCAVLLAGLIKAGADEDGMYGRGAARGPSRVTADGIIFSPKVSDLSQLADDDELAAEEAAAAGGVPGYCRDRMLRAAAGGQYCSKFDVK